MKKLFGLVLVAVALTLVGFRYFQPAGAEKPKFRTLPVIRDKLDIDVSAAGMVEPVEIVDVGAQILGIIKKFGPDPNQPTGTIDHRSRVKEGQLLAVIDDAPYQAEKAKAEANQRLAEADLIHARAVRDQKERDFGRAKQLKGTISQAEYETAESDLKVAEADLGSTMAKLKLAEIATEQAKINLGYTKILSPVTGEIIDRKVNVGQTVITGLAAPSLFLIAKDLARMRVEAAVNEADIGDIHEGQSVSFTVDAYRDRTYRGKVEQRRGNATMVNNVVTYPVVVGVDNADGSLLPYMTAKLKFEVAHRSDVLLVPNQALRWRPTWVQVSPAARTRLKQPTARPTVGGEKAAKDEDDEDDGEPKVETDGGAVWIVADDGLVRPVAVQAGLTDGLNTEIRQGDLKPKTQVVIGAPKAAKPDFVSSFIMQVVK